MNRTEFRAFCANHKLSIEDAGRDWHDAGVNGAYLCAIINEEDFPAIKPLLESEEAYLVSAKRVAGQNWFYHSGHAKIFAEEQSHVSKDMTSQYVRWLESKDSISHYGEEDLAERDKALADFPAFENEPAKAHYDRVYDLLIEQNDTYLSAPRYVTEPGYWDNNHEKLMLSDAEETAGIFGFTDDNWEMRAILVLNE